MRVSHEKISLRIDGGGSVSAAAPVIISASRATDIPAFYSEWFLNRLKKGYCAKINPYSPSQKIYTSFRNARFCVFWTKNPRPIMKHLSEIDKHFAGYYFLFTLNDYEAERLEYVPPLQERIETFIELSRALGKNRVIWRFDPILRTDCTSYDDLLERAFRISRRIQPYTEKMIISFAELSYRKVRRNLAVRADLFSRDIDEYSASESERLDFCHKLKQLMPGEIQISACAQKTDLSQCGIEAAKCIDDDLMLRVCDDNDLKKFLRPEGKLFHDTEILKDPGQRKECRCVLSRDIGAYDTCPHFCLYCYADSSKEKVLTRIKNFNEEREYL